MAATLEGWCRSAGKLGARSRRRSLAGSKPVVAGVDGKLLPLWRGSNMDRNRLDRSHRATCALEPARRPRCVSESLEPLRLRPPPPLISLSLYPSVCEPGMRANQTPSRRRRMTTRLHNHNRRAKWMHLRSSTAGALPPRIAVSHETQPRAASSSSAAAAAAAAAFSPACARY